MSGPGRWAGCACDEKGDDFKVLCVAVGDSLYDHVERLDQVSPHRLREIEHFFATYKLLEDKRVEVHGWEDRRPRSTCCGHDQQPGQGLLPEAGHTKLDLVEYYLAVAEGALRGAGGRPMALKRFVNGAEGEFFFQKRAPKKRPEWIETVELAFPSGRTADEIVLRDAAALAWVVNLGCIDLNPHPVRADDLDHPDELRVDLDPVPGVPGQTCARWRS
jgi:hypothetical protein